MFFCCCQGSLKVAKTFANNFNLERVQKCDGWKKNSLKALKLFGERHCSCLQLLANLRSSMGFVLKECVALPSMIRNQGEPEIKIKSNYSRCHDGRRVGVEAGQKGAFPKTSQSCIFLAVLLSCKMKLKNRVLSQTVFLLCLFSLACLFLESPLLGTFCLSLALNCQEVISEGCFSTPAVDQQSPPVLKTSQLYKFRPVGQMWKVKTMTKSK